jgi:hypothetical protein
MASSDYYTLYRKYFEPFREYLKSQLDIIQLVVDNAVDIIVPKNVGRNAEVYCREMRERSSQDLLKRIRDHLSGVYDIPFSTAVRPRDRGLKVDYDGVKIYVAYAPILEKEKLTGSLDKLVYRAELGFREVGAGLTRESPISIFDNPMLSYGYHHDLAAKLNAHLELLQNGHKSNWNPRDYLKEKVQEWLARVEKVKRLTKGQSASAEMVARLLNDFLRNIPKLDISKYEREARKYFRNIGRKLK